MQKPPIISKLQSLVCSEERKRVVWEYQYPRYQAGVSRRYRVIGRFRDEKQCLDIWMNKYSSEYPDTGKREKFHPISGRF